MKQTTDRGPQTTDLSYFSRCRTATFSILTLLSLLLPAPVSTQDVDQKKKLLELEKSNLSLMEAQRQLRLKKLLINRELADLFFSLRFFFALVLGWSLMVLAIPQFGLALSRPLSTVPSGTEVQARQNALRNEAFRQFVQLVREREKTLNDKDEAFSDQSPPPSPLLLSAAHPGRIALGHPAGSTRNRDCRRHLLRCSLAGLPAA